MKGTVVANRLFTINKQKKTFDLVKYDCDQRFICIKFDYMDEIWFSLYPSFVFPNILYLEEFFHNHDEDMYK
jgi:hypothetical protein